MNEKVKTGINKAYWFSRSQTSGSNNIKLKPYPKYKDSGIQWIGEIPEGWEAERYKIRFKYVKGKIPENLEETNEEGYLPYLSMEYLRGNGKGIVCANDPKSIKVSEGDLLLLWDGSNAGEFVLGKKGYLSSTMVKLNVENFNSNFSWYLCKSFEPLLRDLTIGMGIPHVNGDTLGNIGIPVPNSEDQNAIANFLDKQTAKIDTLIEKDKKLIALLKEKRTALINHVVTKGLDPNVKLKDSGIKWIGKIPEGWEVRRLKFNVMVNPSGKKAVFNPKLKVNFLPMETVSENGKYDIESMAEYQDVSIGYTYFEDNDVLVAKITPCFENGKGTLVKNLKCSFGFGTTEFYVLRGHNNIDSKYLFYMTKTHLFRVMGAAYMEGTAGQKRVSGDFVKNFIMVVPPKQTQTAIANLLDQATSRIDKAIKLIEKKIKLLEEYKKSLIHQVVTGKVDVRGVEA